MWKWLRAAVGAALLAWLFAVVDWRELRALLVHAEWMPLIGACAGLIVNRVITAIKWRALLHAKGLAFPLGAALRTVWVSNFLGQFLPTAVGGDAVRMLTVAHQSGRAPEAVSTVVIERLTGVASLTAVALAGALWSVIAWERHGLLLAVIPSSIVALAGLVLVATRTGYALVRRLIRLLPRRLGAEFVGKVHDAINDYRGQPAVVVFSLLLSLVVQLIRVAAILLIARALAVPLSMTVSLIVVPSALFVGMLPISIGGLGVREGALVAFLGVAGVGSSAAFAIAVLSRIVGLVSNLPGALLLVTHGGERMGVGHAAPSVPKHRHWLPWARARFGPVALQLRAATRGKLLDRRVWIHGRLRDVARVRIPTEGGDLAGSLWAARDTAEPSPAILLVHGTHGPLPLYGLLADRLRRVGITVLTLEMPFFGESYRAHPPWQLKQFTGEEDIAAGVDFLRGSPAVDPSRIVLFGHSFGGSAVVRAGLIVPGVAAVIALGPTRRVEERFAGESALEMLFWRARFAVARRLSPWPELEFVRAFSMAIALEYQHGWECPGHPPLLLMDGGGEAADDRNFLAAVAARLAPPVAYTTLLGADHYLNTAGMGRVVWYDRVAVEMCVARVREWVNASHVRR